MRGTPVHKAHLDAQWIRGTGHGMQAVGLSSAPSFDDVGRAGHIDTGYANGLLTPAP
jgi:hypothetical protein